MRLPRDSNALLGVLLLLLIAGLALLAVLQYRWIDRLTDAERQSIRGHIDFSARHFVSDLQGELETIMRAFGRPEGGDLAERYMDWAQNARDPGLIEAIYVFDPIDELTLQKFDLVTMEVGAEVPWPAELLEIKRRIERQRATRRRIPPPFFPDAAVVFIGPRRGPPHGLFPEGAGGEPRVATLVKLDRDKLLNAILPRLARRHFEVGNDTYAVAVLDGAKVLYRSEPSWPDARRKPDFEMEFPPVDPRPRGGERAGPPLDDDDRPRRVQEDRQASWRLLVRRQDGGLDALVTAARRRNLAVSFGILVILAVTAALLVALLRRSDRLRAQQTQFVAAITHELNTPIAALLSAGENLEAGIVVDREKLMRYGRSIVKESRRLADMVAQVLEFAGLQARAGRRPHEPVDIAGILDEAVAQCRWLVDGSVIDVQTTIDEELPQVHGDAEALTRAVQNLLANAIRHGGGGKWVGLRASRDGKGNVTITVEDRGPGIASDDLSHLFEPFYRGRASGRTRGTGLGLTIVQQIAVAHGGSIEVDAGRRMGAAFKLVLPAVAHA